MITVEQGTIFPSLACRYRVCCFHGQPSKGNVFQRFNFRQINLLMLYGPLMRETYLREKQERPEWPDIPILEIGQPLTDRYFLDRPARTEARRRLGLDPNSATVIYAPSFEYCASLATVGQRLIETLRRIDVNVIVRPHPAFQNQAAFEDAFNSDIPRRETWQEVLEAWPRSERFVFDADGALDLATALAASDVMITDVSGVAFDGILFDLGMIFWDCPQFFSDYLPRRYGVSEREALRNLSANAGRDCGVVVRTMAELQEAVGRYLETPELLAEERRNVRGRLLYNPGRATVTAVACLHQLLTELK